MNDLALLFLLVLAAAFFGALVGIMVGAIFGTRIASAAWQRHTPKFPEFIAVQNIDLQTIVSVEESGLVVRRNLKTSAADMSSDLVEQWLGQRDLMMTPKGKDFQVKAPKVGGGNALG